MKNMMSKVLVVSIVFAIAVIAGSCNVENDRGLFLTSTIKHEGIDWSDGASVPSDYANADGETIGWCSMGTQIQGVTGIWYRNNSTASVMYNLGNVALESVKSFDSNLADSDVCDSPMAVGDVWVIDCKDGYVKFKVMSVEDINSSDWGVEVEYEYSTTTNFD